MIVNIHILIISQIQLYEDSMKVSALHEGTSEFNEIMNGTNIAIGQTGCCIGDGSLYPYPKSMLRVWLQYG